MFPTFEHTLVQTSNEVTISVAHAGSGPALLLLHGYPQSGAMWHQLAPLLATTHHVVVADLRGYGDSTRPVTAPDTDHAEHSFRAMAADQVEVMAALGHDRFTVVGHDRGARTAHRMALDHPGAVQRLAVLDVLPTRHVLAHVDRTVAQAYYHWFFLTQPEPLPEMLIGADPLGFLRLTLTGSLAGGGAPVFAPEALAEYERCFQRPGAVHSVCEDYRAAATIDQAHDEADAGRRLTQPLLALWGTRGLVGRSDVLAVWREYAENVTGTAVDAGHFLAEERPAQTLAVIQSWLDATVPSDRS